MFKESIVAMCSVLGADPHLLASIIEHESAWQSMAYNVNRWEGEKYTSNDIEEATIAAMQFVEAGYTVDVGLMQINSNNLKKYNVSIAAAFDDCKNIQLGEYILLENIKTAESIGYSGAESIRVALSLYNTGSTERGFNNGYVKAVWERYQDRTGDREARLSQTTVELPGREVLSMPWAESIK